MTRAKGAPKVTQGKAPGKANPTPKTHDGGPGSAHPGKTLGAANTSPAAVDAAKGTEQAPTNADPGSATRDLTAAGADPGSEPPAGAGQEVPADQIAASGGNLGAPIVEMPDPAALPPTGVGPAALTSEAPAIQTPSAPGGGNPPPALPDSAPSAAFSSELPGGGTPPASPPDGPPSAAFSSAEPGAGNPPPAPPDHEVLHMDVIQPETPFGADPEDDADDPEAVDAALGKGTPIVYEGLQTRAPNGLSPATITVIVPAEEGVSYDDLISKGHGYTLRLGEQRIVPEDDAKWLVGHPHYSIRHIKG